MTSNLFPTAWLAPDLPGYRDCDGTYCFFDYNTLPPLDSTLFRGKFQWLTPLSPVEQEAVEIHSQTPPATINQTLTALLTSAAELHLTLPPEFIKFMSSPSLQAQIPSCTACYFDLSDHLIQNPLQEGEYFVRFLNDQQDVLFWYLYMQVSGQAAVVVSPIPLDSEPLEEISPETFKANVGWCGDSFESFLYRFWLENTLWFALSDEQPLTPEQQHYLQHYQEK